MMKISMEEAKKLLNDKINHYTGEGDHKQEAEKKAFLELHDYLKENNIEIEHNDDEIEMTPENVEKFHNEVFVKHFWKDEVERREKMGNLERVLSTLNDFNLTEEQQNYVEKELSVGITIRDDEELGIKETGTANHEGELIQEVVLTNGDIERHVCFI